MTPSIDITQLFVDTAVELSEQHWMHAETILSVCSQEEDLRRVLQFIVDSCWRVSITVGHRSLDCTNTLEVLMQDAAADGHYILKIYLVKSVEYGSCAIPVDIIPGETNMLVIIETLLNRAKAFANDHETLVNTIQTLNDIRERHIALVNREYDWVLKKEFGL